MSQISPQSNARKTMTALLAAARDAGWARVKAEITPEGGMTIDAAMTEREDGDDFLGTDLRMGK